MMNSAIPSLLPKTYSCVWPKIIKWKRKKTCTYLNFSVEDLHGLHDYIHENIACPWLLRGISIAFKLLWFICCYLGTLGVFHHVVENFMNIHMWLFQCHGNTYPHRLFIKLCHWFPKVPFFLKMAIFVNLEVPFFIWNKKNQCAARGSFCQEYHPPTPPPSTQWRN